MVIKEEREGIGKFIHYAVWGIIAVIVLIMLFGTFYTIPAGVRGVLLTFGKPDMATKTEGLHVKIPFIQQIIKMDVKTQKYEAELTAASKDLQDVKTKIAINYHIVPERVPEIYRDIGLAYSEKVIYPLEQEANKASTAQYTAEELITRREEVKEVMKNLLIEKLQSRGIVVEEISIINFAFSDVFTQAIETKVTAEQNALAAKNKLVQIEFEAQQRITQAKGEAEAIKIQAQAITQQGGKDYVNLQAIMQWDGKLPSIMGGGAVPFINFPMGQSS